MRCADRELRSEVVIVRYTLRADLLVRTVQAKPQELSLPNRLYVLRYVKKDFRLEPCLFCSDECEQLMLLSERLARTNNLLGTVVGNRAGRSLNYLPQGTSTYSY